MEEGRTLDSLYFIVKKKERTDNGCHSDDGSVKAWVCSFTSKVKVVLNVSVCNGASLISKSPIKSTR